MFRDESVLKESSTNGQAGLRRYVFNLRVQLQQTPGPKNYWPEHRPSGQNSSGLVVPRNGLKRGRKRVAFLARGREYGLNHLFGLLSHQNWRSSRGKRGVLLKISAKTKVKGGTALAETER